MIINNNIPALNTYRQMGINNNGSAKSMEKLSSGLRINRAGDDAAGLAISEKMRAQVRGLDQASRNSQDGISMIQTAEGALQETHNILQRMRELATQAANDTNVEVDRNEIQKEMNQLTSEINRIGNTTEFNTQKLLRGQGTDPTVKNELNLHKSGLVSSPATLAGGNFTPATSASVQLQIAADAAAAAGTATAVIIDQELTVNFNGQDVKVKFLEDNDNFNHGDMVVNDAGNEVVVYLKDGSKKETIARLTEDALRAAIDVNSDIKAEDYNISRNGDSLNITTTASGTGQNLVVTGLASNFQAADLTVAAPTMGDTASSQGVNANRTYASGTVTFAIADLKNEVLKSGIALTNTDYFNSNNLTNDGLNKYLAGSGLTIGNETIEFFNGAEGEYKGSADFAVDLNDIAWATSGSTAITTGDLDALVEGIVKQIGDKMKNVELTDNSAGTQTLKIEARKAGAEGNAIAITDGVTRPATDVVGSTFKATFQIGANQGQSMTIEIGDMRAQALNISGKAGDVHTSVEGAKFTKVNNVTNGTNNENYIAALDVSSHETATAAIKVINNAIETVSAQRSNLGAFQNRLEHTISNLNNASENLQAAESRIRDVDMAREVMKMTKNNILGQASQAMLAQANQKPQSVLQLLG